MAKVLITDTILRDAHQSQAATRMRLDEMLPVAPMLDSVGYYSLECWGGATFDACLRFLNEDPWERLRALKKAMPNTKLQMLFRGQNILGYKHYADDVVDMFVKKSIENGIDIIRIFDALNDLRNLEQAVKSCKKYGGIAECAISYTSSPVHTQDYFVELAREMEQMGADTICIKDMANLLLPYEAYELVKRIKQKVSVPIHLHTHNTTGTGDMTLLKAIEAGVDIVDTALSPLGNGTSQPATEPLVATLKGTEYDTGLDLNLLSEISKHFRKVAERLEKDGWLDKKVLRVDTNTLLYQVPGGMLSNLIGQLKQAGKEDQLMDVLAEVPRVREDFGYPPLVTPTSQIVGTQAVFNVIAGERYKMVTKESKALLRGEYGRLPAPVNEEVRKKCIGEETVITHRPADDIPPEYEKYKQ
ncbi:MAG: pyruvate carboxylase subunit B, partial [Clostridiales bacterium]|nr:pyruvate carboxylase subunit B [Clostridiales bacterium]